MMRQYAYGIMISLPFGLISTVGVFQLQIAGKMKALVKLSAMEGITNLLLDLLFVGAMDMGVAGAGYGTAAANVLRCLTTVYSKQSSQSDESPNGALSEKIDYPRK